MQQFTDRIQAIREELDAAANELEWSKAEYERCRVKYEAAREKFRLIRNLAGPMMNSVDWFQWQSEHPAVQFAAMDLADAILGVLRARAYDAANDSVYGDVRFDPWLSLDEITTELEAGGFDFRTTAPLREVNAALLNMEGRAKDEKSSKFAIENAETILAFVRAMAERRAQEAQEE